MTQPDPAAVRPGSKSRSSRRLCFCGQHLASSSTRAAAHNDGLVVVAAGRLASSTSTHNIARRPSGTGGWCRATSLILSRQKPARPHSPPREGLPSFPLWQPRGHVRSTRASQGPRRSPLLSLAISSARHGMPAASSALPVQPSARQGRPRSTVQLVCACVCADGMPLAHAPSLPFPSLPSPRATKSDRIEQTTRPRSLPCLCCQAQGCKPHPCVSPHDTQVERCGGGPPPSGRTVDGPGGAPYFSSCE
jgi:hypothetical protein